MSYLADAHTDWHHANMDRPWDCPLDCGAGSPDHEYEEPTTGIRCAHCKGRHPQVADVLACSESSEQARREQWLDERAEEQAEARAERAAERAEARWEASL